MPLDEPFAFLEHRSAAFVFLSQGKDHLAVFHLFLKYQLNHRLSLSFSTWLSFLINLEFELGSLALIDPLLAAGGLYSSMNSQLIYSKYNSNYSL